VCMYFSRDIQDNPGGHSSVEDAIATMELVLLKLRNSMYKWFSCHKDIFL